MLCHPSFCSRIKRRWHCIQNSNFVFFLFPFSFPSPLPPFLPQGLSHLMMSEQGRCILLVVLQLPKLLAFVSMAGGSEPCHRWQAICCLLLLSWARLAAEPLRGGGAIPDASWFPTPIISLAFPFRAVCHQGAGPAGLSPRGKHETRHDAVDNGGE